MDPKIKLTVALYALRWSVVSEALAEDPKVTTAFSNVFSILSTVCGLEFENIIYKKLKNWNQGKFMTSSALKAFLTELSCFTISDQAETWGSFKSRLISQKIKVPTTVLKTIVYS